MQRVYRLLKEARERGIIPWEWIVDESRELERASSWDDPEAYARCVINRYRRDYWNQQPVRVEVWSEKGTIRGVLARARRVRRRLSGHAWVQQRDHGQRHRAG